MKLLKLAALSTLVLGSQAFAFTATGNGGDADKIVARVEFVAPLTVKSIRNINFGTLLTSWDNSVDIVLNPTDSTRAAGSFNVFSDDFQTGLVEIAGFGSNGANQDKAYNGGGLDQDTAATQGSANITPNAYGDANAQLSHVSGISVTMSGAKATVDGSTGAVTLDMGQANMFTNTVHCTAKMVANGGAEDATPLVDNSTACGTINFTGNQLAGKEQINLYLGGTLTRGADAIVPAIYSAEFDINASYY